MTKLTEASRSMLESSLDSWVAISPAGRITVTKQRQARREVVAQQAKELGRLADLELFEWA